jgi:hypothetical protein
MKMVLALQHGELPRTLHADEPSPARRLVGRGRAAADPSRCPGRPTAGGAPPGRGLSFGISGTNAHVIVEEAPPSGAAVLGDAVPGEDVSGPGAPGEDGAADAAAVRRAPGGARGVHAWLVSGRSAAGLATQADRGWRPGRRSVPFLDAGRGGVVAGDDAVGVRAPGGGDRASSGELSPGWCDSAAGGGGGGEAGGGGGGEAGGKDSHRVGARRGRGQDRVRVPRAGRAVGRDGHGAGGGEPGVRVAAGGVLGGAGAADRLAGGGRAGWAPAALERVEVVQPALWAVMVSLAAVWEAAGVVPGRGGRPQPGRDRRRGGRRDLVAAGRGEGGGAAVEGADGAGRAGRDGVGGFPPKRSGSGWRRLAAGVGGGGERAGGDGGVR